MAKCSLWKPYKLTMREILPRKLGLTVSKVDKTGRVYIPGDLREALGIGPNEVVEVNVEGERLILEKKKSSVAAKGRGLFKLRRHVEDVDVEIRKGSLKTAAREQREIRRR